MKEKIKKQFPGLVSIARKILRRNRKNLSKTIQGAGNVMTTDGADLSGVLVDIIGDNSIIAPVPSSPNRVNPVRCWVEIQPG